MESLDDVVLAKLADLEAKALRRRLVPTARRAGAYVERDGRRLVSFSCNDYLGLSQHPKVKAAAKSAIDDHGAGAGASRLVSGDHPLLGALEERLAAFKQTEAACLFGSGYLANIGIIPALVGKGDVILVDALAHACIWAGGRLSGARLLVFPHNDMAALDTLLAANRLRYRRALIATDGVFSMDGDLAPVDALARIAARHDAWTLVDDAHGVGVVGDGLRGVAAMLGEGATISLQMGTLSKALGSYGGYVCASRPVVDFLKTRARSLIYTTALAPASAAAALAALDIIEREPEYCRRALDLAQRFTRKLGLDEAQSAVVPLLLGDPRAALAAQALLEDAGYLSVAIRPPTVPEGTARLRFAFSAAHQEADVDRLADIIAEQIMGQVA